nr:hypothetical protein [Tanacetum cinerariifolium]
MIVDLIMKFPNIPKRIDEDYHFIKDDIPLKITIKKKKQITTPILPSGDDQERDEVAEATILSLTLHKTALAAEARENIAKVQEKLYEEEIKKMVEGEKDEESYASVLADSLINNDVDDFYTKIKPGSHKENLENVTDDDEEIKKQNQDEEFEKEKKYNKIEKENNIDDVEKTDKIVKEKDIDVATGIMEFRKEKMQTPILLPTRPPRKVSSFDKTVTKELTNIVSPTAATTSKDSSTSKYKKRTISYKTKNLPGRIIGMCRHRGQIRSRIKNKFITHDFFMGKIQEILDHCNKVAPELMFAKTNEIINKEMPRLVNLSINKDREVDPINTQEMISKEFSSHAPKMIEELFKLDTQEITYKVDMFRATLKLPMETPDNPFVAPVTIEIVKSFMNKVGYQGLVDKFSAFYTKNLAQPWQTMFKVFNHYLKTRTSGHAQTKINILQLFHFMINRTNVDYATLLWWDLMNDVLQKKEAIQIDEDYHFIKDDIPLKITIKKKKQITTPILPSGDDQERDEVAEATILSLTLHKTALAAEARENIAKVQEKLYEEEIKKMVEGEKDEESYASVLADSLINNDVDDFYTKIKPGSHKENLENVTDDDEEIKKQNQDEEFEKEKKYNKIEKENNIDDVEKTDKIVKEKDIDVATGIMEFRKEKMQTPILLPTRPPRKVSSFDKTVTKELTNIVSPTAATTSKDSSTSKYKKRTISYKTKNLPGRIIGMCRHRGQIRSRIKNKFITHDFFMGKIQEILDHCNKVAPELMFAKTNEIINKEMPRLVNLSINKDREVDPINTQEMISKEFSSHAPKMIEELFRKHMQNTTLILYPTTSSSNAGKSTVNLQQWLYLNTKSKP